MDYANYSAVPEKIRARMKYTGTLTGRDGIDVTIRFDANTVDIDGSTVTLHDCILRMMLLLTWPDAQEQTVYRVVHHSEFTTVRYNLTKRPIVHESEEQRQERQMRESGSMVSLGGEDN